MPSAGIKRNYNFTGWWNGSTQLSTTTTVGSSAVTWTAGWSDAAGATLPNGTLLYLNGTVYYRYNGTWYDIANQWWNYIKNTHGVGTAFSGHTSYKYTLDFRCRTYRWGVYNSAARGYLSTNGDVSIIAYLRTSAHANNTGTYDKIFQVHNFNVVTGTADSGEVWMDSEIGSPVNTAVSLNFRFYSDGLRWGTVDGPNFGSGISAPYSGYLSVTDTDKGSYINYGDAFYNNVFAGALILPDGYGWTIGGTTYKTTDMWLLSMNNVRAGHGVNPGDFMKSMYDSQTYNIDWANSVLY